MSTDAVRTARGPAVTGAQYVITNGRAEAIITELAAALRSYRVDGVLVTEAYGEDTLAPGASGITLAPWANRIAGGNWQYEGVSQQLDISEVSHNNASHGLLRNTGYRCLSQGPSSVTLEATIFPQHGYPFLSRHRVSYELAEDGALRVEQVFINDGHKDAPVVLGAHPYLRIGEVRAEELTLTVPAQQCLITDDHLIPVTTEEASGRFDLRSGVVLSELNTDTAYTSLERNDAGLAEVTLSAEDGREVTLWLDEACPYVHIYATESFPGRAKALAVEPMTGPANAFNSGDGLSWVRAGGELSMSWGIRASW